MTQVGDLTIGGILIEDTAIQRRVEELAAEIDAAYPVLEQSLVLICVLKGSILFTADLARALTIPVELEFVACRSYGDATTSSGTVELVKDVSMTLRDRDVLMVEDIIDTGLTTSFLRKHLATHHPRSLRLVSLLDKRSHRMRDLLSGQLTEIGEEGADLGAEEVPAARARCRALVRHDQSTYPQRGLIWRLVFDV